MKPIYKMPRFALLWVTCVLLLLGASTPSVAEQSPVGQLPIGDGTTAKSLSGAAPIPPATITRDEKGHATIRAVRITSPLAIDGLLDEEVYQRILPASDFIQQVPREGEPATEDTEIWVLFDDKNLYIAARCLDSHPEREISTELRRDNNGLIQNESISFVLDTFYDKRNGFTFQTGPLGTIREQSIFEGQLNESWNAVWDVRSARSARGWTTELVIPFKSLRYASAGPQIWGINVRRIVKWKNENSYLSAVPAAYGQGAVNRLNIAGTLVGLETPLQSKNVEFKSYATASLITDRTTAVNVSNDVIKNVGFDFKYGITRGLIADATVNTDFAQVEEDLQQVNLTRFSLFFPEKRDFFLEGQGIFAFGGAPLGSSSGISREIPIMFFSRRIGLSNGQTVPVVAGSRLTGRAGAYSIGALDIQTDDKVSAGALATNFSVLRVKRDILERSTIGVIATRRAPAPGGGDANIAGGLDANFGFFENLSFGGFYAKTSSTEHRGTRNASYRATLDYSGDRYGLTAEHLAIEPRFNPEIGYVRRTDFRRTYARARFSPRTPTSTRVRKLTWEGSLDYIENAARTVVQNRETLGSFGVEFNSGDSLAVEYRADYEFIPRDFTIASGIVVPQGGYDYSNLRFSYDVGQQRKVSGQLAASRGSFYGGDKTEASYSGYVGFNSHFALEPTASLAWVDLPYGTFTARVLSTRTIVTPNARTIISGLLQFNAATHALTSSVRLRWEYQPGSELFIVYSDGRDTLGQGAPELVTRSFAVKVTRLLRF